MTIIKIEPNENGSHDNQTINGVTSETFPFPEGYAVIPESVGTPETLPNYPFGEITVDYSLPPDGKIGARFSGTGDVNIFRFGECPVVTSWTPLPVPEPEPVPEPDPSDTPVTWSALAASIREGVNEV